MKVDGRSPPRSQARPVAMNILVVEDNLDLQLTVCELIGMLGHAASGAVDAEQAWELMRARHVDILLTDVNLPGMSGIALARMARRVQPAIRIIFSTGYDMHMLERLDFSVNILPKPYDMPALQAALEPRA
ncbi:CheY-like chemotaxis protein [Oxalobacteraceae bacterium GrIS 1.11]